MAEKPPKRKTNAEGVLGTLPASRPERIGRPRGAAKPRGAKKPAAVTPGCPQLRASRPADAPPKPLAPPTGTELVTTAIRATGELAQIGFVVSGQVLKRTLDRLKP
jgi:hypothetical protein